MRTLLSWSSGKDSAWTLHVLRERGDVEVVGLVTTTNAAFDRVAMHGVRRALVEAQAAAAGLPLHVLELPYPCPNAEYERIMGAFVGSQAAAGVEAMAFGDLFLEDIRRYREAKLAGTGITPLFPLWGIDTAQLAREMIDGGLVAYVACIDPSKLPAELAGRRFDAALLAELPEGVDPCAENGEFHTFAAAGPMFRAPVAVETGEVVTRDGFVFCDLVPAQQASPPPCGEGSGVGVHELNGRDSHPTPLPSPSCRRHASGMRGGEASADRAAIGPHRSTTLQERQYQPRIVSLIASATEIVCALGLRDRLVGRSHECDYPADVAELPVLTAPKFKVEGSSAEIDARVREIVRDGLSVYRVDGEALKALEPDVIVTQDHCEVCAVSLADVEAATCTWTGRPVDIVSLRPDSLADAYADIARVAHALGAEGAGHALVEDMQRRLAAVAARVAGRARPRVAFIEWVEPLMAGGNWMPELIEAAGGRNLFGRAGEHSGWMQWDELAAADPEVIIVGPCGYGLERCLEELSLLEAKPGWGELSAVRGGRVYFTDGNAFFNRPGPRLAESAEMLVEMIHPEVGGPRHEGTAWVAKA